MSSSLSGVARTTQQDLFNTQRERFNRTAVARRLARLARQALIAEAELTPKPGLVDRRGNGAHTDLSLDLMRRSSLAIEPYFFQMAAVASGIEPSSALREMLALIGRRAERAMFAATRGSNSHKGAIWSLGLLAAASAIHAERRVPATTLAHTAKAIATFDDKAAPRLVSHGDVMARRYGVSGARGEALGGFPHVVHVALPVLLRRRQEGAMEEVARLDALLSIMSSLEDTCLLYRGGKAALSAAKEGARAVEAAGGSATALGRERLRQLDDRLLALNASPGGSADLLAATLFLDAVEHGREHVQADESPMEMRHGND
jgi:triphosphoribosyl-dephospho-CoA synthase